MKYKWMKTDQGNFNTEGQNWRTQTTWFKERL